jgi:hypothetical protein
VDAMEYCTTCNSYVTLSQAPANCPKCHACPASLGSCGKMLTAVMPNKATNGCRDSGPCHPPFGRCTKPKFRTNGHRSHLSTNMVSTSDLKKG